MHLACVNLRMTMNESLAAATLNAAGSLGKGPLFLSSSPRPSLFFVSDLFIVGSSHGSLAVGKVGDMLLIDAPKWEHLIYQMVDPPIQHVIKRGRIVYSSNN
jgi:imidazolonepropionase